MCFFKLFNDKQRPSRPESAMRFASVLSMSDPFETTPTTMPLSDANWKMSVKSLRRNGSPPVNVRLKVPSHFLSLEMTSFHWSVVSSCSSGFDVQRKHVGQARLQM